MREETRENNPEYHDFFATSMRMLMTALLQKDDKEAKKILRFNIRYAYTVFMEDYTPDISPEEIYESIVGMKLEEKSIDELIVIMTFFQAKAGMKPVQVSRLADLGFQQFMGRKK